MQVLDAPAGQDERPVGEEEPAPAAAGPDLYESLTQLLAAVSSQPLENAASSSGPEFVEPDKAMPTRTRAALAMEHLALGALPGPWADDALCAQTDPEIFHPEKGGSTRDAKAICARCPVLTDCREWALETRQTLGIWGGLSARERRALARERVAS